MTQRILIDAVHQEEVRVAVANGSELEEFDFETSSKKQIKGNVYLGKITRVEPSLQAVFVEYGGNRQGFLSFSEIHYDYYQIPIADKEKLLASIEENSSEGDFKDDDVDSSNDNKQSLRKTSDAAEVSPKIIKDSTAKKNDEKLSLEQIDALKRAEELERAFAEEMGLEVPSPPPPANSKLRKKIEKAEQLENKEDSVENKESDEGLEEAATRRRSNNFYRKYKVQEVIKRSQVLLVQVVKEERSNKGASLTTYVSLAGKCCVLMPNTNKGGGVSRRITDAKDRRQLRNIVSELNIPDGASVIVRTAGIDSDDVEIKRDFNYLLKLWEDIKALTIDSVAPSMIHEEGNIIKRSLRDLFRNDIDEILVEGKDGYEIAKRFIGVMSPDRIKSVKEYKGKTSIFKHHKIDAQLDRLYDSESYLKSGGSIVITPTEALVSIDVNSGKSTREKSIEDTAVKTNLEAAREVARQLRLRDLAGLVVIDFIDMRELRHKRAVEKELKDALKRDRARIQVGRISVFGLMEMSRQRMRSSIVESSTVTCKHCSGRGVVRSDESTAITILRAIESAAAKNVGDEVKVSASTKASFYLLNNKREEIIAIETEYSKKVSIDHDHTLMEAEHTIEKPKGRGRKYTQKNTPAKKYNKTEANTAINKGTTGNVEKAELKQPDLQDEKSSQKNKKPVSRAKSRRRKPAQVVLEDNSQSKTETPKDTGGKNPVVENDIDKTSIQKESVPKKQKVTKKSSISESDSSVLKGLWKKITQ